MDHFYITLPSNSSLQYYGLQPMSNYRTRLAKAIHLDVAEWEVGLAEFIYPITWHNIRKATFRVKAHKNDTWTWREGQLPDGHYNDVQNLVDNLNEQIESVLERSDLVKFLYHKRTSRVKVYIEKGYAIVLAQELSQPLGFGDKTNCEISSNETDCDMTRISDKTVTSPFNADVNRGLRSLFIHCDIVQPQLVGDQYVPLLRTVAVRGQTGDVVAESFSNIHYMSIERSTFQEIEIHITDDMGQKTTFQQGRVIVKLHFRRK